MQVLNKLMNVDWALRNNSISILAQTDPSRVRMWSLIFWTHGSLSKVTLPLRAAMLAPPVTSRTVNPHPGNGEPLAPELFCQTKIFLLTILVFSTTFLNLYGTTRHCQIKEPFTYIKQVTQWRLPEKLLSCSFIFF